MRKEAVFLAAAFIAWLNLFTTAGAGAGFHPKTVTKEGQFAHTGSGIVFPVQVGSFSRGRVIQYDPKGDNVSVAYNLALHENPIAITVYVYPGERLVSIGSPPWVVAAARRNLMNKNFQGLKKHILKVHSPAILLSESDEVVWLRGNECPSRQAVLNYTENFAWRKREVRSYLLLIAFGKWLVKYRITHPKETEHSAKATIQQFKDNFETANPD